MDTVDAQKSEFQRYGGLTYWGTTGFNPGAPAAQPAAVPACVGYATQIEALHETKGE